MPKKLRKASGVDQQVAPANLNLSSSTNPNLIPSSQISNIENSQRKRGRESVEDEATSVEPTRDPIAGRPLYRTARVVDTQPDEDEEANVSEDNDYEEIHSEEDLPNATPAHPSVVSGSGNLVADDLQAYAPVVETILGRGVVLDDSTHHDDIKEICDALRIPRRRSIADGLAAILDCFRKNSPDQLLSIYRKWVEDGKPRPKTKTNPKKAKTTSVAQSTALPIRTTAAMTPTMATANVATEAQPPNVVPIVSAEGTNGTQIDDIEGRVEQSLDGGLDWGDDEDDDEADIDTGTHTGLNDELLGEGTLGELEPHTILEESHGNGRSYAPTLQSQIAVPGRLSVGELGGFRGARHLPQTVADYYIPPNWHARPNLTVLKEIRKGYPRYTQYPESIPKLTVTQQRSLRRRDAMLSKTLRRFEAKATYGTLPAMRAAHLLHEAVQKNQITPELYFDLRTNLRDLMLCAQDLIHSIWSTNVSLYTMNATGLSEAQINNTKEEMLDKTTVANIKAISEGEKAVQKVRGVFGTNSR